MQNTRKQLKIGQLVSRSIARSKADEMAASQENLEIIENNKRNDYNKSSRSKKEQV